MVAKDIEIYHITYEKAKSLRQSELIIKTYRKTYAIRRKRAKACRSAYQKGYQSVGNLWGLVEEEDRSDYHSSIFSIV